MSYQTSSKRLPPFCVLIGQKNTKVFWHQSEGRTAATVWNWFGDSVSRLLFFCFTSSVSGTQNKCPNSHHNRFITWISRECKAENGLILYMLLVVKFLETISCWWNMFNFGEYAEIYNLLLTSLKESNFPWLILKFPDLINCLLRVTELIFLAL